MYLFDFVSLQWADPNVSFIVLTLSPWGVSGPRIGNWFLFIHSYSYYRLMYTRICSKVGEIHVIDYFGLLSGHLMTLSRVKYQLFWLRISPIYWISHCVHPKLKSLRDSRNYEYR